MEASLKPVHVVVLGVFPYPHGMADTKRVQNVIDGLRLRPGVSVEVMVLRQSSRMNPLEGTFQGVRYRTVMGDLLRMKMLLMSPVLHFRAKRMVTRLLRPGAANVLYVYGPPSFENIPTVRQARRLGFRVAFDIVEDDDLGWDLLKSPWHRLKNLLVRRSTRRAISLADAVVVISSHLEQKFARLTGGRVPIHRLPVSVNLDRYPELSAADGDPVTLFYAGSYAKKDGVPVLLDAFDHLARTREGVRLVLSGVGSAEDMGEIHRRLGASPYRDRIVYKGYLEDADYYRELNRADILCMTRVDTGFAQAGFPFKLGEYLATGKPVIASAVSDVPKLLKDREDVVLVRPGDAASLVEAAEFLLDDRVQALRIGANGRRTAQELFDYRSQGERLHAFLLSISG